MERLTKKLRALLEFIKECYSISDIETFSHRDLSRLSKIAPKELTSYSVVNTGRPWNACAIYPAHAYTRHGKKIFEHDVHDRPVLIHHAKTHHITQGLFQYLGLDNKLYPRLAAKYRVASRVINQGAVNRKTKNLAAHDKLFLKLLSPHINQACLNAETLIGIQQKLTLVDRALYRLNVGLIFLTPDGKVLLATTWAMERVTSYLGPQCLRKNRLPERLWTWVKQQEVASSGKDDVLPGRSPLVLKRDGKRLVIRLVSDLDQNLLLLEEHPTTMQLQSLVPFGLSPREAQVLDWVSQGKTNKEIGVILELSPRTVQKHLEHIYRKIYVESRTAAAAKAYEIASLANTQIVTFFLVVICALIP
jgi:DNA-binding CsgD family transcriptional regulator